MGASTLSVAIRAVANERGERRLALPSQLLPHCCFGYFSLNRATSVEPSCAVMVTRWQVPGFFGVCQL